MYKLEIKYLSTNLKLYMLPPPPPSLIFAMMANMCWSKYGVM